MSNSIQKFCREFRINELDLTLDQMGTLTGVNLKTISAFENGRSNNSNHIYLYSESCITPEQLTAFKNGLSKAVNTRV